MYFSEKIAHVKNISNEKSSYFDTGMLAFQKFDDLKIQIIPKI